MRIHAIVLAAGSGTRFGAAVPKQFMRLADEPILLHSVRAVGIASVQRIVVVTHPTWLGQTEELIASATLAQPVTVVAGGATRNESTRNGLDALDARDDDIVIVHDAVRPLVPPEVVSRVVEPIVAGRADATEAVVASPDTIVVVDGDRVSEVPDRSRFRRVQTPQAFRRSILALAYERAAAAGDLDATDDCSVVVRYVPGARVIAVAGDERNIKITTPLDMALADRIMRMTDAASRADLRPMK